MAPADPAQPARSDPPAGSGEPIAADSPGTTDAEAPAHPVPAAGAHPPEAPADSPPAHDPEGHDPGRPATKRLAILTLTALGVVFGDIGTSPLYALRECFSPHYGLAPTDANVRGVLSLIVWALVLVVSVKYVAFILRADNRGEGGVMALLALLLQRQHRMAERRQRAALIALGLFGSALLYGDGMITPAISVLSATEGLAVATPALHPVVLPLTLAILVVLFWVQRRGTARVGAIFGPVMVLWFASIAVLGAAELVRTPSILAAANPWYAVRFFADHPMRSFVVLGAVVLVITGGEALYADMGHFGKRPIRFAWFGLVLPALLLNYFGQGALLVRDPTAITNPFYLLAPAPLVMPMVVVATLAAVVASQALISGAFSLTQQCIQLGFSPRLTLVHTSARERGQIYIREVNKAIAIGTILLVLGFRSSSALGSAYGVAVTGTMAITSVLFYFVTRQWWGWSRAKALAFLIPFLSIDLLFFASNLLKVHRGGWVPLVIAGAIFVLMATWREGRRIVSGLLRRSSLPMELFLEDVARRRPVRVPGTAVFMTSQPDGAPVVLLHHLKHNKVLHEKVILLTVAAAEVPGVPATERVVVEELGEGIHRVRATYGFLQTPDIRDILARCADAGLDAGRPMETSYYLGRERLVPTGSSRMARWRKKIFVVMARNAQSAGAFFGLPANRVVELGAVIEF